LPLEDVERAIRNNPVHPAGAAPADWPRDWTAADVLPPTTEELTPAMLAEAQRVADASRLPQTVWPSRFIGRAFRGADCLLVAAAVPSEGWRHPDAAGCPGTVLRAASLCSRSCP